MKNGIRILVIIIIASLIGIGSYYYINGWYNEIPWAIQPGNRLPQRHRAEQHYQRRYFRLCFIPGLYLCRFRCKDGRRQLFAFYPGGCSAKFDRRHRRCCRLICGILGKGE